MALVLEGVNKINFVVENYRQNQLKNLKLIFPDCTDEFLLDVIDEDIRERFFNPQIRIHNNYTDKTAEWTLNKFLNWYDVKRPITTEHGTMYMPHNKALNIETELLSMFLSERKVEKKFMLKAKEKGDKQAAEMHNLRQKVLKILANSYYGCAGQASSVFYNLYVALSITGKGQSIISTAMTTFENFLTGSIKWRSIDEVLVFINNVKIMEKKDVRLNVAEITKEELFIRLKTTCKEDIPNLDNVLKRAINNLTPEEITIVYYKNNLFSFMKQPSIMSHIEHIVRNKNPFRTPEKVPPIIKPFLDELWESIEYYVFYNFVKFDKINILKNDEREAVLGVDTDSNFLGLYRHYKIIKDELVLDEDNEEDTFKVISMLAYFLSKVIEKSFALYTANCNVPEDKRAIINMKNECVSRCFENFYYKVG